MTGRRERPSASRTPALALRRSTSRGSLSASTGSTAAARARPAARGWGSPSSSMRLGVTRRISRSRARRASAAASARASRRAAPFRWKRLRRLQRNNERLAHELLARDQLARALPRRIEYQSDELLQGAARFLDRAAVRVDMRQLLDEADVAVLGLEKHRGECHNALFHVRQHMRCRFPLDTNERSY